MNAQRAIALRFVRQEREARALGLGADAETGLGSPAWREERLAELEGLAERFYTHPESVRHRETYRAWLLGCARAYGLDEVDAELLLADACNAAGSLP